MSLPRYPEYKDSGVEWLGEVPEHWEVTALKRVVNPERQITYGIVQAGPHVPDGIPYIRPADMRDEQGVVAPDEVMRTSPEIASGYSRSTIREGDLVCSIGPSFGKVMVTPQWLDGANLTQGTARIAVQLPHDARYLFWTLRSSFSVAQWESSVGGATFRALNLAPLAETTILVPAVAEQTQIAAFLDRETAKIDELVAEQRRLMELLKEKRQAVISHAVTQGLNPHAPMKPSGIEWLGDVPAHWEVWPLGRTASDIDSLFIDGDWIESKDLSDVGIRYLTSGNVGEGIYKEQGQGFISQATFDELNCIEVLPGDVLISRLNLPIGRACIVPDLDSRIVTCVDNVIVRPNRNFDRRFFVFLLTSKAHFANMEILARGTTMQRISRSTLAHVRFAFPPETEQTQIAAFLDAETAKLDTLTTEAQRAIDLLQERRTALISAAVTGQIDVRPLLPARKVGTGETATQEASKLVNLPHENHT